MGATKETNRRLDAMIQKIPEKPESRHRATAERPATMKTPRPWKAWAIAVLVTLPLFVAIGMTAFDDHDAVAPPNSDWTVQEQTYLYELGQAGIELTPEEEVIAVQIAREHVAHGHLIGMRSIILADFAARIPRLSEEEDDVARIAVEHHFLAVTGRKQ